MEKFTGWRDKGTGIAPFLPPSSYRERILWDSQFVTNFLHLLVFIPRAILAVPLLLILRILKLRDATNWVLMKLVLANRVKLDLNVFKLKKSEVRRRKKELLLQPGDIYFINYSSAFVAVLLEFISAGPIKFLVPENGEIYELSWRQFVLYTLDGSVNVKSYITSLSEGQVRTYAELVKKYGKESFVWIVVPEGTCSNGRSVLPLQLSRRQLETFFGGTTDSIMLKNISIQLNSSLTTPLKISPIKYLGYVLLKATAITAKVRFNEPVSLQDDNEDLDTLRMRLNDNDKFKLVSKKLDLASKREFMKRYY